MQAQRRCAARHIDAVGWYLLFAPTGTPREVLERLNSEIGKWGRAVKASRATAD